MSTVFFATDKMCLTETALREGVGVQVTGLQRDRRESPFSFAQLSETEVRDLRDSLSGWLESREETEESTGGSRTECRSCSNDAVFNGLCGDCNRNQDQKAGVE